MVRFLFPHRFKTPGIILLLIMIVLGIVVSIYNYEPPWLNMPFFSIMSDDGFLSGQTNNMIDEILSLGIILGGILTGFSREKIEDEYISKIRLESLVWAVYVNFFILALSIILISGLAFFSVMIYNMFTLLLFFVIRFNWILIRNKRRIRHEE